MNITLKQLRVFAAVAQRENVSRAAIDLSLTQSAVSMALKELELQLDLKLFDRVGKRMLMNQQGYWLLPRAQGILDQIQMIASESGKAGPQLLAVGASTTIADCLFPALARHLYGSHPDLELRLETGNTSAILTQVLARKIELGLIEGVCQHPQLIATPWWTDHLVIVANPAHPLVVQSATSPVTIKALAGSRWIMREAGSGTRAIFEHAFRRQLSGFNIVAELRHVPTIKALVASGDSLACLSGITVAKEIAAGTLAPVSVRNMRLERQFFMLQHKQVYQSDIHAGLVRWVMQQAAVMKPLKS